MPLVLSPSPHSVSHGLVMAQKHQLESLPMGTYKLFHNSETDLHCLETRETREDISRPKSVRDKESVKTWTKAAFLALGLKAFPQPLRETAIGALILPWGH